MTMPPSPSPEQTIKAELDQLTRAFRLFLEHPRTGKRDDVLALLPASPPAPQRAEAEKVRCFRHRFGFVPEEFDRVRVVDGVGVPSSADGSRCSKLRYSISECEEYVRHGEWLEVPDSPTHPSPKPEAESNSSITSNSSPQPSDEPEGKATNAGADELRGSSTEGVAARSVAASAPVFRELLAPQPVPSVGMYTEQQVEAAWNEVMVPWKCWYSRRFIALLRTKLGTPPESNPQGKRPEQDGVR